LIKIQASEATNVDMYKRWYFEYSVKEQIFSEWITLHELRNKCGTKLHEYERWSRYITNFNFSKNLFRFENAFQQSQVVPILRQIIIFHAWITHWALKLDFNLCNHNLVFRTSTLFSEHLLTTSWSWKNLNDIFMRYEAAHYQVTKQTKWTC